MTEAKTQGNVMEEILRKLTGLEQGGKRLEDGLSELKGGQQKLCQDMTEVKTDISRVKDDVHKIEGDVTSLQDKNLEIERRLRALEEGGQVGSEMSSGRYEWHEAVEYARRVVVFTDVEDFPEDIAARKLYMRDVFVNMGMTEVDLDRYRGMRIYQTNRGKGNKRVNVEFESNVHASQVLRMKQWKGDSEKRVNTKICIPEACHNRFVELDKMGFYVREKNKEFRYDIRYLKDDMVLFLKPGIGKSFYPVAVGEGTNPADLVTEVEDKDAKMMERRGKTAGRGGRKGAGRGGKATAKRKVMRRGDLEEIRDQDLKDIDSFRKEVTQRKPMMKANEPRFLGKKSRSALITVEEEEEDFSELDSYVNDVKLYQCDGTTSPVDSPNKIESHGQVVPISCLYDEMFDEFLKSYKLDQKRLLIKAKEKFEQNEPYTVDYGDPEPEGLGHPTSMRCRSIRIELNPVYYHQIKETLLARCAVKSVWSINNNEAEVVLSKPFRDKGGYLESHQIEFHWKNKRDPKITMFLYHTTFNMRIQGKRAEDWWTLVLEPIYQGIIEERGTELRDLKNLAREKPDQAASALVGIRKFQTKLTDAGISFTSPSVRSNQNQESPSTGKKKNICQICKKGNVKKLTFCPKCKLVSGHASCLKNKMCPTCAGDVTMSVGTVGATVRAIERRILDRPAETQQMPESVRGLPEITFERTQQTVGAIVTVDDDGEADQEMAQNLPVVLAETRDQDQSRVLQISTSQDSPKEQRTPKRRAKQQRQSRQTDIIIEAEDMRVDALAANLAMMTESRDYWRTIALNHQEAESRRNSESFVEKSAVTVHNTMSLSVEAKELTMSDIKKSTISVTDGGKILNGEKTASNPRQHDSVGSRDDQDNRDQHDSDGLDSDDQMEQTDPADAQLKTTLGEDETNPNL